MSGDLGGHVTPTAAAGTERSLRDHRIEAATATTLFGLGVGAFFALAWTEGLRGGALALTLAVFGLVFLPLPSLGVFRWRRALGSRVRAAPGRWTSAFLAVPLLLYAVHGWLIGAFDFRFVGAYVAYVGPPSLLVLHAARAEGDPLRAPVRTGIAALALWIPLDFGWLPPFRLPAGTTLGLDLMRIVVLAVGAWLLTVAAPVRDLGYAFLFRGRELGRALLALFALALVLVPLGLALRFLDPGLVPFDPLVWGVMAITLYFATTLHEEFLFRGVIQNLAEKGWRGPRAALAGLLIGSAVFAIAHLNNPPAPNLRYVLMAFLAGLAYGWVWVRTRKVTVSALTHMCVNWTWMVALRGG